MNEAYSEEDARLWLNAYIAQSQQDGQGADGSMPLSTMELNGVAVESFTGPETYRLTTTVSEEQEELVLRIPGVLCQKNLPPFLGEAPTKLKHVRKLRQFVKLSGLGSPIFGDFDKKISEIHSIFAQKLSDGTVQPLTFRTHEGHFAIDLHCRYFTDRKDAPDVRHHPFGRGVDPLHQLDDARRDVFIHGEENIVQYCRNVSGPDGSTRREQMDPGRFEVGDIVEATVSFVCYPIYQGGYVIRPTLRCLTLAMTRIREEAKARRENEIAAGNDELPQRMKRRSGDKGKSHRPNKRRFLPFPE